MTNRRQLLKATLGLPLSSAGLALAPHGLNAQGPWPTRTITVVVPFPPGGTADLAGRPLALHLSEKLGQNVVVENKDQQLSNSIVGTMGYGQIGEGLGTA